MSAEKRTRPKGRTIEGSLTPAIKLKDEGDWYEGAYLNRIKRDVKGDDVWVYTFKATHKGMDLHNIEIGELFSVFGKANMDHKFGDLERQHPDIYVVNAGKTSVNLLPDAIPLNVYVERENPVTLNTGHTMVVYEVRIVQD